MLTTRDISDYDVLMKMRLKRMEENNLTLTSIREIVSELEPLDGAIPFMKWLRERFQVTILTGSYYEYIMPLMKKLDYPCTFANSLVVENDNIV
jgi:phosphoserine/homoserine phosphotransferase